MDQPLNDADVRVLGALIEKEVTTPDNYPLSLNALIAACNQSSNRTPVVAYDEAVVLGAIQRLRHQSLVRGIQRMDSRVTKYQQLLNEALNLSPREMAILCVLMLRGPNTAGELRSRTERLADFASLADVDSAIALLVERQPAPLVVRLPRQAGQKEVRLAHLLSGEPALETTEAHAPQSSVSTADRLATLEQTAGELRLEMAELKQQLADFRKQFE